MRERVDDGRRVERPFTIGSRGANGASPQPLTLAAWLGAILIAAGNPVAVRLTVFELAPFWGATIRVLLAGLLLTVVMFLLRLPAPTSRALIGAAVYGAVFFGANFAFIYWGLQFAPAATASVVNSSVPLLAFGLAILHRLEVFQWRGLIGGLFALAGIAIVFADQVSADVPLIALVALTAGAVCAAEVPPLIKLIGPAHPVVINAVGMLVGGLLLALLSAMVGESWAAPVEASTVVAVVFLIVAGTALVDFLYVFAIRGWTASAASYALVVIPPLTIVYAALLLDEAVSPLFLLGSGVLLLGVWLGALSHRTRSGA